MNNSSIRPGDWSCKKCGANNFARRTDCFKCYNLKDGSNQSSISDELIMIKLLHRAKSVAEIIEQHMQVYKRVWKQCLQLSQPQLETLIVSMAKLPASFVFEVPPLVSHCRMAAERYINFEEKKKADPNFKQAVLPKIENIVNFVKVYLLFFLTKESFFLQRKIKTRSDLRVVRPQSTSSSVTAAYLFLLVDFLRVCKRY